MKTTQTLSAALIALSFAVAGAAHADTGGPVNPANGQTIAAEYVNTDAQRLAGNPGAPAGSIAVLANAVVDYQVTPLVATADSGAPAGSIALLSNAPTTSKGAASMASASAAQ